MGREIESLLTAHERFQRHISSELYWLVTAPSHSKEKKAERMRKTALARWRPYLPQLFLLIASLLPFVS